MKTDVRRYGWLFAGRQGSARSRYLVLKAPKKPGTYRLFVEANGHGDQAVVVVARDRT